LRDAVVAKLGDGLSPEQVVARLALEYPGDQEMRVCHETIYQAVYIHARGGLKREVVQALRTGRAHRRPHGKDSQRRGRIKDMVSISQRPMEADDRAVPGHHEGDLIIGKGSQSAVATVVERSSRFVMLGYLPGGHTAPEVQEAIVPLFTGLPATLRRTLTWDQGREMAGHLQVAEAADIKVYFADPHSPWQRGSNENTNGLLRQYLPKGVDLKAWDAQDLQAIADKLNARPRKTLGWLTPTEALTIMLGGTVIIAGRTMELPASLKPLTQRRCIDP
jgi:IS30 family transposase